MYFCSWTRDRICNCNSAKPANYVNCHDLQTAMFCPIPFPFSDASATKRRSALVIAESDSNNMIVCPITSKPGRDHEIKLEDQDFRVGKLNLRPCYIRPNIIATVNKSNVIRYIGKLKNEVEPNKAYCLP